MPGEFATNIELRKNPFSLSNNSNTIGMGTFCVGMDLVKWDNPQVLRRTTCATILTPGGTSWQKKY